MDKRTVIGIILIVLITMLMPYYQKWIMGPPPKTAVQDSVAVDTSRAMQQPPQIAPEKAAAPTIEESEPSSSVEKTPVAAPLVPIAQDSIARVVIIENPIIRVRLSNTNGAGPAYWELKKYKYYLGGNVNLINDNGLDVVFTNQDGKEIHLRNYRMFLAETPDSTVVLNEQNPTATIKFYLPVNNGRIVKTYTFYHDKYSATVTVHFEGLGRYVINRRYEFSWVNGLPSTEENVNEDYSYARAFAYMAGELEAIDASKDKEEVKEFNGRVDWAAVRTKYFLAAVIPSASQNTNGVMLTARGMEVNRVFLKQFDFAIDMPYSPEISQVDTFTVFLGPLDYDVLKQYKVDLQTLVMNKDWYERLFRPFSLLILAAFKLLHQVIPNYGWVLIIFAILIKLILHPLTKKSYQSMSEMQYLQPKMQELREKYKNDPQRLNMEMMKLYKEHGVNPLGGCLPTLLQMPLLFALFIVFRSTIQLRGQPFILWITDLSQPDKLHLGVHLPLIGDTLHVLPILMAVTMIWQSKMTITDPKQKSMMYIMPVFMLFIFYSLPSGLNLYYTVFNLLSMVQTYMIKKKMHPNGKPELATGVSTKAEKGGQKARRKKK